MYSWVSHKEKDSTHVRSRLDIYSRCQGLGIFKESDF